MSVRLFDEIDNVPWGELHHAYGPAVDVPDLLRALMWPEEHGETFADVSRKSGRRVFDIVADSLWENVFHQGSVWQVTATTVPFFIEVLRDGPDDDEYKLFVLTYLYHLAFGFPKDSFPDLLNPDDVFAAVEGIEDPGGEPDYAIGSNRGLIWMRDSYEAVERHIESVIPFLDAEDNDIAEAAIVLCGAFYRRAAETAPLLRKIAQRGGVRGANASLALALLVGADARDLTESFVKSDDLLTSVLGACAAVQADNENVNAEAVTALIQPLGELSGMRTVYAPTLGVLAGRYLARLGSSHKESAIDGICKLMVHAEPMASLSLTDSLLTLAFNKPPLPSVSDFTASQRRALEVIRDYGGFQKSGMIFGNYTSLIDSWGLPQAADEIGVLLRDGG